MAFKLCADELQGLQLITTCLQDAIIPIREFSYRHREEQFWLCANRFRWEQLVKRSYEQEDDFQTDVEDIPYERVHSVLKVQGVKQVQSRNIDLLDRKLILSMLTIEPIQDGLLFIFAGTSYIWLEAPCWRCWFEDVGYPWPTWQLPRHEDHLVTHSQEQRSL